MQETKEEQKEEQYDRCFLCNWPAVYSYPCLMCASCHADWAE